MFDRLEAECFSPLGAEPLVVIDLNEPDASRRAATLATVSRTIVVGVDCAGALPSVDEPRFDCLLTAAADPPRPWVHAPKIGQWLAAVTARVAAAPVAAATCMRVLRINEGLAAVDALAVESLAYSTLLSGDAFRRWRVNAPSRVDSFGGGSPVHFAREGNHIILTLAQSSTRNAMTAAMRDALWEALAAVLDDPSRPRLTLRGDGACFSTGGHLPEFGTATDLAQAHAIRTARSCAELMLALGDRAEVVLHGACIGSGIEVPAAAARRRVLDGAFFQLPELAIGLMPGAGGTVTLPRAIGRHRTAALVLSGRRLPARTALDWGLIHSVETAA